VDDFGLHEGVNQAVFDLLALRRISAVSCLVDGPAWASGAAALRAAVNPVVSAPGRAPQALSGDVMDAGDVANAADAGHVKHVEPLADVGLHLNFTEALDAVAAPHVSAQKVSRRPVCLPVRPIGALIKACYLRQLNVPELVREIDRQWDCFEAVWGRAPDFIDGHQHAHQLPQIRDALLQVLHRRCQAALPDATSAANGVSGRVTAVGLAPRPWVRQCRSPSWRGLLAGVSLTDTLKAGIIGALGAGSLGAQVSALGLPRSQSLLGVYPFDADAQGYVARWRTWLQLVRPQGDLLMCHPAAPQAQAPALPDVIGPSRHMEHAVLCSEAFGQLLQDAGVRVARLGR
jgi:predicted glycoside hydrolase/deacetylase ChbG (UPF0249 family)